MSEARRADKHSKARTAMLEEFERQKAELVASTEKNSKVPSDRFTSKTDTIEESLKKNTVGLVSAEDFKKRREELEELKRREAAQTDELK
jgi:protein FAM50